MKRWLACALVVLIVFIMAGCRRAELETREPAQQEDQTMTAQNVDVQLGEWFVRLKPDTVKPGQVHFAIKNVGNTTHAFEIEGQDFEERSINLDPNGTTEMTVTLRPGTYETYCPIGNHEDHGMRAEFTVRE